MGKYTETLCRIHASFAVNPLYVSDIGRFYVKMQDGKRLSVPEKKYTAIKAELQCWMKR